jgi:uncharacterized membrane protein HdeD (DUF308 family)
VSAEQTREVNMDEPRSPFARIVRGTHRLGLALIGLGLLCAVAPAFVGAPLVLLVGLLLAIAGVVRATFGWRAWSDGRGPIGIVVGGLAAACGLALVFNPVSTLEFVSSLVAVYFVIDGIAELFFSGGLRDEDGRAWVWADAMLSIALGWSMWVGWPLAGMHALGVLVGIKLVSGGAVMLRVERGLDRVGQRIASVGDRLERGRAQ